MKHCTTCQHLFADQLQVCPNDTTPLRQIRELEPGMIVGNKYIILEWIGAGGMAAVYRARHRLLDELRAVKVVFAKFSRDEDFLRRFRHEAAIARRLRHENAVWVEDLDEIEDGRPFIAMEFLEGDDLRKLIKEQGPLSVERSLKLGAQVASALSAAHKLGIVHRDIKPDNIFITRDSSGNETAKVLDFGIAKAREGVLQGGYTATKTGVIIGTPEYMSPEQAEGHLSENLDGRADIYSLGIVLYEMLTGKLPFESDTPLGMCMHHLQTVPRPPHELRPDLRIPEAVSAVLMKALEKRRERRFQTADEMLAALRNPAAFAGNGTGAFAATKVFTARTDDQPTAALASGVAAAAAQRSPAITPAKPAPAKIESPKPVEAPAPAIRTGAFAPITLHDKGKRLRIAMVTIVVVVCAAIGYMLLKVNARRNAALQEHDVALHDLIAGKLQSSPQLQGKAQNITVTVNSDAVTLSGNVPLPGDKEEAENLARAVSGVSSVENNIVVSETTANTVTPASGNSTSSVDSTHNNTMPQASDSSAKSNGGVKNSGATRSQTNVNLARSQANTLIKLGNQKLDDGKYAAAIADFQHALRLDRNNSEARAGLDRAHRAQKTEEELEKK
ncbi:MAG TPA: protein kinase [Candidatus Angelobacter sp.]